MRAGPPRACGPRGALDCLHLGGARGWWWWCRRGGGEVLQPCLPRDSQLGQHEVTQTPAISPSTCPGTSAAAMSHTQGSDGSVWTERAARVAGCWHSLREHTGSEANVGLRHKQSLFDTPTPGRLGGSVS